MSTFGPQRFGTCAVVGSGHDLRCGEERGSEIDAHEAVFRSNSAQHAMGEGGFEGTDLDKSLRKYYRIADSRGGRRTTFRINCLFGNRAAINANSSEQETCVIAQSWFHQPWGKESTNNERHTCCTSRQNMRSSYSLPRLQALEAAGARFAFFRGVESGDESIDSMLNGSGGNALHAALALCRNVDVYGAGLFSAGPTDDKIYAHAYDSEVGLCLEPGSRVYEFGNARGLAGFFRWRRDRVRSEMLMHVLHELGVFRWVQ